MLPTGGLFVSLSDCLSWPLRGWVCYPNALNTQTRMCRVGLVKWPQAGSCFYFQQPARELMLSTYVLHEQTLGANFTFLFRLSELRCTLIFKSVFQIVIKKDESRVWDSIKCILHVQQLKFVWRSA
jgi:hypothetical protein